MEATHSRRFYRLSFPTRPLRRRVRLRAAHPGVTILSVNPRSLRSSGLRARTSRSRICFSSEERDDGSRGEDCVLLDGGRVLRTDRTIKRHPHDAHRCLVHSDWDGVKCIVLTHQASPLCPVTTLQTQRPPHSPHNAPRHHAPRPDHRPRTLPSHPTFVSVYYCFLAFPMYLIPRNARVVSSYTMSAPRRGSFRRQDWVGPVGWVGG